MNRAARTLALLLAMAIVGVGVNRYIAAHKTNLTAPVGRPDTIHAAFTLPGTIYVVQAGAVYALNNGTFTDLGLPNNGRWMQPHAMPDGSLLAVAYNPEYSDLYHVSADGKVIAQLTKNLKSTSTIQLNHWVYYPTTNTDGGTVYASYDLPKPAFNASYQEDLSVWAGPLAGKLADTRWTTPDPYTGGDVQPQPLPDGGGLIYTTYAIAPNNHVESVIAFQPTPEAKIVQLTTPDSDCNSPALSPDGTTVAMVCTADTQTASIQIAHFANGKFDTPTVVVPNCLCNSPAWAPDGSGIVYIAPTDDTGHFQLWWLAGAGTSSVAAPRAVTDGLDLDALSPPTWSMPRPTSSAATP